MKPNRVTLGRILPAIAGFFLFIHLSSCSDIATESQLPTEENQITSNLPFDFQKIMNSRAFSGAELQTSQSKARLVVKPGESIQAAVDAAKPHQTILIEPGTYREAIVVDKPGLKLIGKKDPKGDGVVIENPGYKRNGIRVTENGDGFRLARVTIKDFGYNGVLLTRVRGFEIFEVTTIDNGEYGLFPVHSSHGLIHHSSASGHSDTGIYVGKSEFVAIQHSTAHGNVNGFEIENCSHVTAFNNTGYNNTAGMLVVLLPGLAVKVSSDIEIVHNRFFNNNLPNFADPDDIAAAVPKGSGILVVGTDNTRVMQNTVTGNDFVGIGVGSTLLLSALAGIPPEVILGDIEPDPDGAEIRHNKVVDNGTSPPPLPPPLTGLGADLFWDGSGTDNCWDKNIFNTSIPADLPSCTPGGS